MKTLSLVMLTSAMIGLGFTAAAEIPGKTGTEYLADARLGEQVDRICFREQVNDFREPTQTTVIMERGTTDYLVETQESCSELEGAQTVALDGTYSNARCVTTSDRVAASQSAFGRSASDAGKLCRIKAIYEWNEDAAERDVSTID
jgi:hypothetical protein